ncbi:MAG: Undecaprenyl-phosphate mannosyltransferase [Chloroflexi bacterium ADurb.Bin325]|nr:MAG: Undecaprenyl-phosphate mannosyltransferase [Chloroflexi bacterium ADurb.Bin325]
MTHQPEPLLSIIIPAYNEEHRLPRSLDKIIAFIEEQADDFEVLIVENGSRDRTTEVAEAYAARYPYIHVLHSEKGKGAAVRAGMLAGRGRYLFMCDSDLSMPITEVRKFLPPRLTGYDIAIASREGPGAHRYGEPAYRHLMGRVFNLIIRVLAIPHLQDTQCGFKSFRRDVAREVFGCLTMTGWSFDVEALFIALRRGYEVIPVPVDWYFDADSRVNPLHDTWRMFRDVVKIRLRGLRGAYARGKC